MNPPSSPARPPHRTRSFLARLFADRQFDALQNRTQRRRASLVQLVTLVALFVGIATGVVWPDAPLWLIVLVPVLLLLPFFVATGRLNASIGGVTEIRTRDLDEVQQRVRDSAYRRAYAMLGLSSVVFMLATFAFSEGWLPGGALLVLGWIVFNLWLGAPAHLLAWTLPDVDEEPV